MGLTSSAFGQLCLVCPFSVYSRRLQTSRGKRAPDRTAPFKLSIWTNPADAVVPTASWLWKSLHMCTQHDCSLRSVMTRTCHSRARHRGGTVKVWKREKVDREKFWNCPFLRSALLCELEYFQPCEALIPQVSQSTVGKWRTGTTAVSHWPDCSALSFEDYKWIAESPETLTGTLQERVQRHVNIRQWSLELWARA